jgi:hypothetical protein
MQVPDVSVPNSLEAVYDRFMREGWGDGLPIIPPTAERVHEMLRYTDREPEEVIGVVANGWGEASVLLIAVNAVMAGCRPEYLPVVIAAVKGLCEDALNLYALQSTTNPVALAGFVNGPAIESLGFNAGCNCLGQGNRANATVGRAIRLIAVNIGGGRPGEFDRATQGQPAKYSFFFAENEKANPWEPFHVERGFDPEVSTVTVLGASGTLNLIDWADEAADLLRAFSVSLCFPNSSDHILNGEPWLILSPDQAAILKAGGHTKASIRQYLWENTRLPFRTFTKKTAHYKARPKWEPILGELQPETLIPIADVPDRIRILVAGGPGYHSIFVPTFGDTRAVTVPIADRNGKPMSTFGRELQ